MGRFMAMRVLQDLSVFTIIAEKGRITSEKLADATKADQTLIGNCVPDLVLIELTR